MVQERSGDQDQFVETVVTIQVGLSGISQLLILRYKLLLGTIQFSVLRLVYFFLFFKNMVTI